MAENTLFTTQEDGNNALLDSPLPNPADGLETPPETAFLKRYNDHLEMPTSIVSSICIHVAIVFALLLCLNFLMKSPVKAIINIDLIDGEDESGKGSPCSANEANTDLKLKLGPTAEDLANFKTPQALPRIHEYQDRFQESTEADITIPNADQLGPYAILERKLADKLLGFGQNKGEGPGTGVNSGQIGNGPGGSGADSTRERSMRWVMRFTVQDGRDYLRQLAVLKATVLIPVPPANKDMIIFKDLTTNQPNRPATTTEVDELSRQMRFCDITSRAVNEVALTFKLNFTPQCFFAFFPKDIEAKLARDEENFRGRKAKDIEETIFVVTIRGESYDIRIVDQTPKKK